MVKYVDLPIQHISDKVLRRMNRHYDTSFYRDLVQRIRKVFPYSAITTDIMVGFAGETEEDFLETLDLVKQVRFSGIFTFIYAHQDKEESETHRGC